MSRKGGKSNSLKQPKEEVNVKYMHKPPSIEPNYGGQKRTILPKSKVSRVLLYDNATQDHMLDIKLAHIAIEKERICRLINLHKRSFSMRQMKKQHMQQALSAETKSKINKSGPNTNRTADSDSRYSKMPPIQRNTPQRNTPLIELDTEREENANNPDNENANNAAGNENANNPENENANNAVSETANEVSEDSKVTRSLDGIKLPAISDDKRHVIFKVQDKNSGSTRVYHTVDDGGMVAELIPLHTLYPRLTDDPRFRSLHSLLVPLHSAR